MREWNLLDFPDAVYVVLDTDFRERFFSFLFKKFGGIRPCARAFGLAQTTVKNYARGFTVKFGKKHPQAIPISFLKKSCLLTSEALRSKLHKNVLAIKCKNKGSAVYSPILPIRESPALYRIVAHMIGDGHASPRKVPYYVKELD